MKKKINFFFSFFSILFFTLIISSYVFAKVFISDGEGRHSYGPNISENKACGEALIKAKTDAIRKILGEDLSSEEQAICDDDEDPTRCRYNSFAATSLRGQLGREIEKKREIKKELGQRTCIIQLKTEIRIREGKPDPSFKARVTLNGKTFKHGENLKIKVEPKSSMYLYIFQYLPYDEEKVTLLFPDPTGKYKKKNNLIKKNIVIPEAPVKLVLRFPNNVKNKNSVDEHLIIVMTKKRHEFFNLYTSNDFRKELLKIPANEIMEKLKIYKLVKE